MPSTGTPLGGLQGYVAQIQAMVTRITNLETWQRSASAVIQPGVITQWAGSTPPPGALACDGSSFSASTYPQLAVVIPSLKLPTQAGSVVWTGPRAIT